MIELTGEELGTLSLGGRKPSVCLLRIRNKVAESNYRKDYDVLRHRLMQVIPFAARISFLGYRTLPLDQYAKVANTIYSYTTSEPRLTLER